jgi:outer membrane protein OmpA-like peptidoglycan-associated protein
LNARNGDTMVPKTSDSPKLVVLSTDSTDVGLVQGVLLALTDKAKSVDGYMIEVKGFASAPGGAAVNQKLSEDRANNVTNILLQQGKVPLTKMLAPGAMG